MVAREVFNEHVLRAVRGLQRPPEVQRMDALIPSGAYRHLDAFASSGADRPFGVREQAFYDPWDPMQSVVARDLLKARQEIERLRQELERSSTHLRAQLAQEKERNDSLQDALVSFKGDRSDIELRMDDLEGRL